MRGNSFVDDSSENDMGKILAGVFGLIGKSILILLFPLLDI